MPHDPNPEPRAKPQGLPPRAAGPRESWCAPDLEDLLGQGAPNSALERLFELEPERWLRRLPGRETFAWPGQPQWIVKRTVGGERREYWHERLRGQPRAPARRELENLLALASQGFPVPRGLAWFAEPSASGHPLRAGRSALVMECVEHQGSLRERLGELDDDLRHQRLEQLLELVTGLHRAGWIHRDLYLQHFVCTPQGLVLLDVGRARQRTRPRERWFVKDLAALHFSAPESVSGVERLRFLRAWLTALGLPGVGRRREWVARITRRGQRMADHRPKHVDPGDPTDAALFP